MTDQTPKPQTRKLRPAETMRERAERTTAKDTKAEQQPRKLATNTKAAGRKMGSLPIWKPLKFVGRFIIPPYLRASWRELRQVTWPNRQQTRVLTTAVILFSVVFGAVIAAFDFGLDKVFKEVILK